jgi:hypothetical protein
VVLKSSFVLFSPENVSFSGVSPSLEAENLAASHSPNLDTDFEELPPIELAPNQAVVTLSYSLMSQAKQLSRFEGVSLEDMIIELLAEGIARRGFEDSQRSAPSHLMTRTGYVPPEAMPQNSQPFLSHHANGYPVGNHQKNQRSSGGNTKGIPRQNGNKNSPYHNNRNAQQNFNGNINGNRANRQNNTGSQFGATGNRYSNGE